MRYYTQNVNTDTHKGFNSLKKACEYAIAHKQEGRQLVHIGYYNLYDTDTCKDYNELYKACREVLNRIK